MVSRRGVLKKGAIGLVALTGCLHGQDTQKDDEGERENDGTEENGLNVGVVYGIGGLGDASFNDAAETGVKEATEEFGVDFENFEPETPGEIGGLQEELALSDDPEYDLVVCVGVEHADPLGENADELV